MFIDQPETSVYPQSNVFYMRTDEKKLRKSQYTTVRVILIGSECTDVAKTSPNGASYGTNVLGYVL